MRYAGWNLDELYYELFKAQTDKKWELAEDIQVLIKEKEEKEMRYNDTKRTKGAKPAI